MNPQSKVKQFYIGSHLVTVDDNMIPILCKYTWYVSPSKTTFYAATNVKIGGRNHILTMHRLITGMSSSDIDHINRNGLDNRIKNLRFASKKQNSYNRERYNKYGYRGVFKRSGCNNYAFQIQKDNKKVSKGGFSTAEDAGRAYDLECLRLHGEFGIINFPEDREKYIETLRELGVE